MGEAKRRRESGEMDLWFHGTNEYFEEWSAPPVRSKYKFELVPHSFISLSKDRTLASGAGDPSGGLCGAKLLPDARVLDLRADSSDGRKHWEMVCASALGRKHLLCRTYDLWRHGCSSGDVLRMMTDDPALGGRYERLIHIANSAQDVREAQRAHVEVQNFTRSWIDTVINPARTLGYEAVICCEIDSKRRGGPKSCLNLHVFSPRAITRPLWLNRPDEARMVALLDDIRRAGIDVPI